MLNIHKLYKSFGYAVQGIVFVWKRDQNIRIHFVAALLVILLSLVLDVDPFQMVILGVMILLVIVTEMVNSTIENIVDLITKQHHEQAKFAKDVAAGMVLITVIGSVVVGILILVPYFIRLFR